MPLLFPRKHEKDNNETPVKYKKRHKFIVSATNYSSNICNKISNHSLLLMDTVLSTSKASHRRHCRSSPYNFVSNEICVDLLSSFINSNSSLISTKYVGSIPFPLTKISPRLLHAMPKCIKTFAVSSVTYIGSFEKIYPFQSLSTRKYFVI